jgi:enoyl-CoA hydratase/carnithine racemase
MRSEVLDTETAQAWGFIDERVDPDALADCAARWADLLAGASRTSMAGTKSTLRAVAGGDPASLAEAHQVFLAAFAGPDFAEGAAAFLQGRAARFA